MSQISKLYSVSYDAIKRRILKVFQYGPVTAFEVAPFGDDSNPIQGMDAIYMETDNDAEPVIIGYINKNQKAAAGEKRFYSVGPDGKTEAFYTWLKNDGTYEIGGDQNNLVRYNALNTGLQEQVTKINAELAKISAGITTAGGVYNPSDISIDITDSKIDEIKCL